MATFHLTVKAHSRSANANSIALSSYRSGEKLRCETDGKLRVCRQGHKSEVLHTALLNSRNLSREELWNKVEKTETRKNSVIAREIEVALPYEVSQKARNDLAVSFAGEISKRYNCAVDLAVHAPDNTGDDRNFHAHILFTPRSWQEDSNDFSKKKYRDLNIGQGNVEVRYWRELWAEKVNKVYADEGISEKVEASSCKSRKTIKKYQRLSYKKFVLLRREGKQSEYIKQSHTYLELDRDKLTVKELIGEVEALQKIIDDKENQHVRSQGRRSKEDVRDVGNQPEGKNRRKQQECFGESESSISSFGDTAKGEGERSKLDQGVSFSAGNEYEFLGGRYWGQVRANAEDRFRNGKNETSSEYENLCSGKSRKFKEVDNRIRSCTEKLRRNLDCDRRPRKSIDVHTGNFKDSGNEFRRRVIERKTISRRIVEISKRVNGLSSIVKRINSFYQRSFGSASRDGGISANWGNSKSQRIKNLLIKAAKPILEIICRVKPLLRKESVDIQFKELPPIKKDPSINFELPDQSRFFPPSNLLKEKIERDQKDREIKQRFNTMKKEIVHSKGVSR
ncbi:MAG: MobA/MobL family protein [Lentisphaeraceae bacterium]|nr:MobA/MobL family protein [Lentisphaeraceae bacterium]